ncbi:DMT family transporter [Candidatus Aerophobetes bacterium]|nr:DMT family transporter [Candidatus Aerophobetes bacterium]
MVKGYVNILFLSIANSFVVVLNKLLLTRDFNIWIVGFFNFSIAAALLFSFTLYKSGFQGIRNKESRFATLVFIGLMGFLYNASVLGGLTRSTPVNASILLRADIMFSTILAWIFLKERLFFFDFLGMGLMMFGFFLVTKARIFGFKMHWSGDSLFLLAAIVLSINALMIKKLLSNKVPGSTIAMYNATINAIFFAIFVWVFKQYHDLRFFEERNFLLILMLGILTGMNYIFYYGALRWLPIWLVRTSVLFIPIFTAIISYGILSEMIIQAQLYGMIFTISGAAIIIYNQSKISKKESMCYKYF